MNLSALLLLSSLFAAPDTSEGEDWPGWRGPDGSGVAKGSPPVEWSEEKNVRWKTAIPGKGNSSPVVWGDRVFITTAVSTGKKKETPEVEEPQPEPPAGEGGRGRGRGGRGRAPVIEEQEFHVLAMNRADGAIVWQKKVSTAMPHQGTHPDGTYASPTPVTDGEHLFVSFGSYGLYAFTMEGEIVWEKDLGDLEIFRAFGEGSSPIVHGDTLIVNWDHNGDSFIVALEKKTGKEKWRRPRKAPSTWVTPLLVEFDGKKQVIVASSRTIAYDLANGEELWSFGSEDERSGVITSPVHYDGLLFLATGSRRGALRAIILEAAQGELKEGESDAFLWTHQGDTPHIPSPIVYDGIVYMLKSNSGLLSAFDIVTGERVYGPQRLAQLANAYASPVAADGKLYFSGREGTFEVVAAGPEFASVSVNTLEDTFDASPAIAGNELFLRGRSNVYCIAEK